MHFHPRTIHSDTYYYNLLSALIKLLRTGLTDAAIAEALNAQAMLSPLGKPFTANSIKQILKRLRNYADYPSVIHKKLLQLVFDGKLRAPDTYILFEPRRAKNTM